MCPNSFTSMTKYANNTVVFKSWTQIKKKLLKWQTVKLVATCYVLFYSNFASQILTLHVNAHLIKLILWQFVEIVLQILDTHYWVLFLVAFKQSYLTKLIGRMTASKYYKENIKFVQGFGQNILELQSSFTKVWSLISFYSELSFQNWSFLSITEADL
mgnify:CR=1 FL=1